MRAKPRTLATRPALPSPRPPWLDRTADEQRSSSEGWHTAQRTTRANASTPVVALALRAGPSRQAGAYGMASSRLCRPCNIIPSAPPLLSPSHRLPRVHPRIHPRRAPRTRTTAGRDAGVVGAGRLAVHPPATPHPHPSRPLWSAPSASFSLLLALLACTLAGRPISSTTRS